MTTTMQQTSKWAIVQVRSYYGPESKTSLVEDSDRAPGTVLMFASRAEARKWIAEQESGVYPTAHNESGRPEYKVVEVGGTRFCRAYRQTYGGAEYNG